MANFTRAGFTKYDGYMTPASAWRDIKAFIPMDKIIYEPFYGDGTSGKILRDMGCKKVIHQDVDFFTVDAHKNMECIISNMPFSIKKEVFTRLKKLNKPFIMIVPISTICTQYMINLFKGELQLIIPKKRIQFLKLVDGVIVKSKGSCNFDCAYVCWQMGFEHDMNWV